MIRLINRIWILLPFTADLSMALARWWIPIWKGWRSRRKSPPDRSITTIGIATTNICNAKCVFCAYPVTKQRKGVMTDEVFRKARSLVLFRDYVDLTPTVGDPLIDPNLVERVCDLSDSGRKVSITTNLIGMNSKLADGLVFARLSEVFVSIPSFRPDDYQSVYGVEKCHDAIDGLDDFIDSVRKFRAESMCKIHIRFRNRLKPSEVMAHPEFKRLIASNLDILTFNFTPSFDNWGGTIKELPKGMRLREKGVEGNRICKGMKHLSVLFDGKVRLCGCRFKETELDDLVIGDVDDSMEELEFEARKIQRAFEKGERPTSCKNCSFYDPT